MIALTEYNANNAWYYNGGNGCMNNNGKYNVNSVRSVTEFRKNIILIW